MIAIQPKLYSGHVQRQNQVHLMTAWAAQSDTCDFSLLAQYHHHAARFFRLTDLAY